MAENSSFEQSVDVVLNLGKTNLSNFNKKLEEAIRNIGAPEATIGVDTKLNVNTKELKKSRLEIEAEVVKIDKALEAMRKPGGATKDGLFNPTGADAKRLAAFKGRTEQEITAVRALYTELMEAYSAVGFTNNSPAYLRGRKLANSILKGTVTQSDIAKSEKNQRDLLTYWSRTKERYDLINKIKNNLSKPQRQVDVVENDSLVDGAVKTNKTPVRETIRPAFISDKATGQLASIDIVIKDLKSKVNILAFERKKLEAELSQLASVDNKKGQVKLLGELQTNNNTRAQELGAGTGTKQDNERIIKTHADTIKLLNRKKVLTTAILAEEKASAETIAREKALIDEEIIKYEALKKGVVETNRVRKSLDATNKASQDAELGRLALIRDNWKKIAILKQSVANLRSTDTGKGTAQDVVNLNKAKFLQAEVNSLLKKQFTLVNDTFGVQSRSVKNANTRQALEQGITEELREQRATAATIIRQNRALPKPTKEITEEQRAKNERIANRQASEDVGRRTLNEYGGINSTASIPRDKLSSVIDALKAEKIAQIGLRDEAARNQKKTVEGSAEYRKYGKAIDEAQKGHHQLSEALRKSSERMSGFRSITEQASATLRLFFRYAIGYGALFQMLGAVKALASGLIDLDDRLNSIRAISGATAPEIEAIGAAIKSVAVETQFNVAEIAQAAETLAQAGVKPEDMASSLQNVALFASATNSALDTSADLISTMRNVFTDLGDRNIADQLTKAVNISKLTAEDLKTILSRGLQVADAYNISSDQFLSAVTVLRNAGVKASTVSTGLRQSILELMSPDAKTIKALKIRYDQLGENLTTDAIKSKFSAFSSAANPLLSVLREMKRLGADGTGASVFDRVFDVRAQNVINVLLKDLNQLDGNLAELATPGAAADGARKQMDGFSNSAKNLGAAILNLSDTISGNFVSSLAEGLRSMTEFTKGLNTTLTEIKAASGEGFGSAIFSGLAAGAGVGLSVKGGVGKKVGLGLATAIGTTTGVNQAQQASPENADVIGTLTNLALIFAALKSPVASGVNRLRGGAGAASEAPRTGLGAYVKEGNKDKDFKSGGVDVVEAAGVIAVLSAAFGEFFGKAKDISLKVIGTLASASRIMAIAKVGLTAVGTGIAAIFTPFTAVVAGLAVLTYGVLDYFDIIDNEVSKATGQTKAAREQLENREKTRAETQDFKEQFNPDNINGQKFKVEEQTKIIDGFNSKLADLFGIDEEQATQVLSEIEDNLRVLGTTGLDAESDASKKAMKEILGNKKLSGVVDSPELKEGLTNLSAENESAKSFINATIAELTKYVQDINGDVEDLGVEDLAKYNSIIKNLKDIKTDTVVNEKLVAIKGFMDDMADIDLTNLDKDIDVARGKLAEAQIQERALKPETKDSFRFQLAGLGESGSDEGAKRLDSLIAQMEKVAEVGTTGKLLGAMGIFTNATETAAANLSSEEQSALVEALVTARKRNDVNLGIQNETVTKSVADLQAGIIEFKKKVAADPILEKLVGDTKNLDLKDSEAIRKTTKDGRERFSLTGEASLVSKAYEADRAKLAEYENRVAEIAKIFVASAKVTEALNKTNKGIIDAQEVADYELATKLLKERNQLEIDIINEEKAKKNELINSGDLSPTEVANAYASLKELDNKIVKAKADQLIALDKSIKAFRAKELSEEAGGLAVTTSELTRRLKELDPASDYEEYSDTLSKINAVTDARLEIEAEQNLAKQENDALAKTENDNRLRIEQEERAVAQRNLQVAKLKLDENNRSLAVNTLLADLAIKEYEANRDFNPEALPDILAQRYRAERSLLDIAIESLKNQRVLEETTPAEKAAIDKSIADLDVRKKARADAEAQAQDTIAKDLRLQQLNRTKQELQQNATSIDGRLGDVSAESSPEVERSLNALKAENTAKIIELDRRIAVATGTKAYIAEEDVRIATKALERATTKDEREVALAIAEGQLNNFKIANAGRLQKLEQEKVTAEFNQDYAKVAELDSQIYDNKYAGLQDEKAKLQASLKGATADEINDINRDILNNSQELSQIIADKGDSVREFNLEQSQRDLNNASTVLSTEVTALQDALSRIDPVANAQAYKDTSDLILGATLKQLDTDLALKNLKGEALRVAQGELEGAKSILIATNKRAKVALALAENDQKRLELSRPSPEEIQRQTAGIPETDADIASRNNKEASLDIERIGKLKEQVAAGNLLETDAKNQIADIINNLVRLREEARLAGRSLEEMTMEGYNLEAIGSKFQELIRNTKSLSDAISDNLVGAIDKVGDAIADAIVDGGDLLGTLKSILYETAKTNIKDYIKNIYNKGVNSLVTNGVGGAEPTTPEDKNMSAADIMLEAAKLQLQAAGGSTSSKLGGLFGGTTGDESSPDFVGPVKPEEGFFNGMFSSVKDGFSSLFSSEEGGVMSTIGGAFKGLFSSGSSLMSGIGGVLTSLFSGLGGGGGGGGGGSMAGGLLQLGLSLFASKGMVLQGKFAEGGILSGKGTETSDEIPALLTSGGKVSGMIALSNKEAILNAKAVRALGAGTINAINKGSLSKGSIGGAATSSSSSVRARPDPTISMPDVNNSTRIVNIMDPSLAKDYMESSAGERVIVNAIKRNAGSVNQILR